MKKLFPNWKWTWRTPLKFVMPAVLLIILICHRNLYFGESALKNVKATVPLENQRPAVFFLLIVLILLWCLWIFHASYGKHAGDPRLSALRSPVSVPVNLALVFGNAVLSFYLIELINNYYLLNMKTRYLVLGWMINFVLYLIAVFLLNSLKIGMITGNIFFIVWGIVNYFVQQFRGIPFQWIDFGSMRTAMSVSGNYRYTPTWQMITGVILVFVVCSFWSKRRTTLLFMNRAGKIGSRASAIILLFAFWVVIFRTDFLSGTGIWLRDWQPWYTYRLFGMESGFLAFAKASFPEAPEGYHYEPTYTEESGKIVLESLTYADGPGEEPYYHDQVVCVDDTPDGKVQTSVYRRDLGIRAHPARKGRMRQLSYEWLAGLREIVIDPVRCPLTYEEFVTKEYERDRDGTWLDIIPDGFDHSIDAVRYALMDDILRG